MGTSGVESNGLDYTLGCAERTLTGSLAYTVDQNLRSALNSTCHSRQVVTLGMPCNFANDIL